MIIRIVRTPLQRHNRAMNRALKTYRAWQTSEAGSSRARIKHRQHSRLLQYLHKLEDAQERGEIVL